MSLGMPLVTQGTPHTFHSNTSNLGETLKEKGSSFLQGMRYGFQWFTNFASKLTPTQIAGISLVEQGLNEGGSIETLLSGEVTIQNAKDTLAKVADKTKKWKESAVSTHSLASEVLKVTCQTVKKSNDFLWAFDSFGLSEGILTKGIHGCGYAAASIMSLNQFLNAEEEVKKVKDNPTLIKVKKTKFALTGLVAITGFFTLFISSIKLTLSYLALTTMALGANLTDYFLSNKNDPYRLEREAIQKQHKPPVNFSLRV